MRQFILVDPVILLLGTGPNGLIQEGKKKNLKKKQLAQKHASYQKKNQT